MKRYAYIIAAFALLFTMKSYSQDDRLDQYSFEQAPLQEESSPYFALGLGYAGSLHFPNFDLIDKTIKERFGADKFNKVVWFNSVEGFTSLVFVPNLRLSFMGASGGVKSTKTDTVSKIKSTVEFQTGLTGLSLDYAYVPFTNFAIVGGSEIGWGEYRLLAYQAKEGAHWGTEFGPGGDPNNYYKRATRSIWHTRPHINVELALTSVILLRVGAGYTYDWGSPTWELNNSTALMGVPKEINYNGFDAQIGLFFGLFHY